MEIDELKNYITDPSTELAHDILTDEYHFLLEYGSDWERREFVDYVSDLISVFGSELQKNQPKYYDDYQKYWLTLALKALITFTPDDREEVVAKSMFSAVRYGYDPDELLDLYYDNYASDKFVTEQFTSLLKALRNNQEPLGSAPIEVEGRKYLPQVRYWILDYTRFPSKVAQRGNLERLNYINTSPNTRQLTQVQRQQLIQLLKFHDDLMHPQPARGEIDLNVYLTSPGTDAEESAVATAETASVGQEEPQGKSEIVPSKPVLKPQPAKPLPSMNKEVRAPEPVVQAVDSPFSEIIRREKAIQAARHEALIQQKLEELKKKVSK